MSASSSTRIRTPAGLRRLLITALTLAALVATAAPAVAGGSGGDDPRRIQCGHLGMSCLDADEGTTKKRPAKARRSCRRTATRRASRRTCARRAKGARRPKARTAVPHR